VGPDRQTVDRFRAALFVRRCAGRAWHGRTSSPAVQAAQG
jgi:hypothetical protein